MPVRLPDPLPARSPRRCHRPRPAAMTIRLAVGILLSCCFLPLRAQPRDRPLLALAVTATDTPGRLHVVLRNTSAQPLHVLLGYGDGSGHVSLDAFSFRFVDARGGTFDLEALGIPLAGVLKIVNEILAPGQAWSADIELKTLVVKNHMAEIGTADHLSAASYTVEAIYTGRPSEWPRDSMPLWVGSVTSPPITYIKSR